MAALESPRGVQAVVRRAAQERGMDPWKLTRRIAELWLAQGHVSTLHAGRFER